MNKHLKSNPSLTDFAIVVDAERDNVAVARRDVPAGTVLEWLGREIVVRDAVMAGHRFALRPIPCGEWALQYGQPFARSRGLQPGEPVDSTTVVSEAPRADADTLTLSPHPMEPWSGPVPTFSGFRRADGRVGVRNWILIIPTSMCAAHEAARIAAEAETRRIYTRDRYPTVDGVVALTHTGGCSCPDISEHAPRPGMLETTLTLFQRHMQHPNVGAVLLVELGCEKTNLDVLEQFLGQRDLSALAGKPVHRLSIQECGGTQATIRRGLTLMPELLEFAGKQGRSAAPISELALGLECGGSDAFSGLSANPALGYASDTLVRAGGRSVIAEVPEFVGAEHLFAGRAVSPQVAQEVLALVERYRAYAARGGHDLGENPSPGNRAGGLLNITIKSLGAIAKSGTAPVQGTIEYGEWLWDRSAAGLYMLNTPGYDQASVPGLVAAGCQIVCFTTGRGTGIGNAIAPVIKIGSNSRLYERMAADIDVNAGTALDGTQTLTQVGETIFERVLATASGEWTKAELNGHREFALWDIEGITL